MIEPVGYTVVALFAIGMAVSFVAADPHSPTSRALSVMFLSLGTAFFMNLPASAHMVFETLAPWGRLFSFVEMVTIVAAEEWVLRIGRTEVAAAGDERSPDTLIRSAQVFGCLYGLAGILFPGLRQQVWNVVPSLAVLQRPEYYLFAIPFNVSLGLTFIRVAQLLRADLDRAERVRLIALTAAVPFWCAGFFIGWRWNPISFAIGEMIFLVGAIRYHVIQGQRGQFLARFLSPHLTKLVRERGLPAVLQQHRVELSVLCCDLRGFTEFAESAAPEDVMSLLQDYYATVGDVVTTHGGSIKDFAGDGILALIGAPIAHADHAERAVRMALAVHDCMQPIFSRFSALGLDLGMGIGLASGFATVGTIGGQGRLEYAAVGSVVNLAARLCQRADSGQILAEPRIAGLVGAQDSAFRFAKLGTAELKGFARPVTVFAVDTAVAAEITRSPAARG